MADIAAIELILQEIEKDLSLDAAILVSRSGMHIAGDVPKSVHSETFVAMFAILLGAAETATSELKQRLQSVTINLDGSRVMVVNDGPKAIYVLRSPKDIDAHRVPAALEKYSKRLEEFL